MTARTYWPRGNALVLRSEDSEFESNSDIHFFLFLKAESLKNLVDEVTSENIEYTHTMEKSILKMYKSKETTYHISWKMTDEFQEYLSLRNLKLLRFKN